MFRVAVKVLLEMEGRGILQDLIPDFEQWELSYVLIKEWIIDPDAQALHDGTGDVVCLPTNYGEIVHTDAVTRSVTRIVCGKVRAHFKGCNVKNLLVAGKRSLRSGVICRLKCDHVGCEEEYTGKLARTFGERFKEHIRDISSIYD